MAVAAATPAQRLDAGVVSSILAGKGLASVTTLFTTPRIVPLRPDRVGIGSDRWHFDDEGNYSLIPDEDKRIVRLEGMQTVREPMPA